MILFVVCPGLADTDVDELTARWGDVAVKSSIIMPMIYSVEFIMAIDSKLDDDMTPDSLAADILVRGMVNARICEIRKSAGSVLANGYTVSRSALFSKQFEVVAGPIFETEKLCEKSIGIDMEYVQSAYSENRSIPAVGGINLRNLTLARNALNLTN